MKSFFKKNIRSKISEQKQEDSLVFMWISAGEIEPPINFDTLSEIPRRIGKCTWKCSKP